MTKTLATLIKVHQHAVDEQRRVVAQLESARERMVQGLAALRAEMAHERAVSDNDAEAARRWPDYITYALKREVDFNAHIAAMEQQIAAARDELQRRFAEQKKFEIAKENYDAEAAAALAREEQIEMDEIAGVRDGRRER